MPVNSDSMSQPYIPMDHVLGWGPVASRLPSCPGGCWLHLRRRKAGDQRLPALVRGAEVG
jgi:hypothetical protein